MVSPGKERGVHKGGNGTRHEKSSTRAGIHSKEGGKGAHPLKWRKGGRMDVGGSIGTGRGKGGTGRWVKCKEEN